MEFKLLTQIDSPMQLRELSESELPILAQELRDFLVDTVSRTGGHLASNLGVIELTIALHYIFNTPEDRLVWDVGHQSYAHKVLTGRREAMKTLRQWGGIAGFPKRSESIYDTFDVGHSSTSIGAALGMAVAAKYQKLQRKVVAIIGDGAMTAGMAFEALNHAGSLDANLLVILNDNDMSISQNVGALSNYLAKLLSSQFYTSVREGSKQVLKRMPTVRELAKRTEEHMKGMVVPGTLFEELGFNYIGPIDGHDLTLLLTTLTNMKALEGPQFLHIVTRKGKGFALAEKNPCGYHGVSAFDPKTGKKTITKSVNIPTYTQVFGEWLCDMAAKDARLVGITPAMREGSGLVEFSKQFPTRYLDVGIAEQHSLTLAAGLACEGLKPVVAIYSTFLQRAYDQLIHDIALQNLSVLLAIDRAGIVGADGPTHAGSFDLTYLRCIPNLIIMTPANENECRQMLTTGFLYEGASAVRYPRAIGTGEKVDTALTALPIGKAKLCRSGHKIALLVFGTLLTNALQAAEQLEATVVNMRFVKPLDIDMVLHLAQQHDVLVTIEENVVTGGAGSLVNECLHAHTCITSVLNLGLPDNFTQHGDRTTLLKHYGLDTTGIVRAVVRHLSVLKPETYLTGIVTTAKTK